MLLGLRNRSCCGYRMFCPNTRDKYVEDRREAGERSTETGLMYKEWYLGAMECRQRKVRRHILKLMR